jgi:hypothetical protein
MSLLASLVFALVALGTIAAVRVTVLQYRDAALANIAALRNCSESREFRVQAVSVIVRQSSGDVRRIATRVAAPRRIRSSAGLRAAA